MTARRLPTTTSGAAHRGVLSFLYRDGAEVLGNPVPEQVEVMRISPEFFATLGVNLAMGRTFTEEKRPWREITESSF